jgi:DNA polymerase-1
MASDPTRFFFDCETWLIAPGRLAPRLVSVAYQKEADLVRVRHRFDDWRTPVRAALETCEVIGHNVAYDLAVLVQADPSLAPSVWRAYDEGRIFDTMIRAQLIAIALGRFKFDATIGDKGSRPRWSLAALVQKYLGEEVTGKHGPDIWRMRYHELDECPVADWPDAARAYAMADVDYTARLWHRLGTYAAEVGLPRIPDEADQVRAAWSLHLAACWGIRTDEPAVDALEAKLRESVAAVHDDAVAAGLIRSNGTKNVGAIRARVDAAFRDGAPQTAKGATRIDTATLAGTGDDLLVRLSEVAGDEKELAAFVPTLRAGVDLPINPRWNTLVESGRVSCSRPNLTQQPRRSGVRECYVPRPGYWFATADYAFAELCTLAQTCIDWFGESALADTINAGRDPHRATGANLLGLDYETFNARFEMGDMEAKQARQLAKAIDFGFPGGLGASTFVEYASATYGLDIDEDQARELKRTFVATYPELSRYWRKITDSLSDGGGSFTAALVRSGRIRGGLGFPNGCNYFFQGPVADGAKRAFYLLTRESRLEPDSPVYGSKPLILMHDEIISEVPVDLAAAAAQRVADVMVETLSEVCPDVKIVAEPALMRRWHKGAAPTYVDGRLVPWEPSLP